MKSLTGDNFLLENNTALTLYNEYAKDLPIVDYHCHIESKEIAEDTNYENITKLWLGGDHYKWRAMRANGVSEDYLTGGKYNSWETFKKWAETVPYTMRNPLYHWTHLELSRVFGIDKLLCPATAREIFEECTTDDPADDLRWHKKIAAEPFGTKVIPAWRPDKAMAIENPESYKAYLRQLGEAAGKEIDSYADLQEALKIRHDYFAANGCKLSDHGLETFYAADYKELEIELIFKKVLMGIAPGPRELEKFRSAFLHDQAVMDAEAGWTQQFHVGAIRNNNSKMFGLVGPDTGFDAIHDLPTAAAGHKFLDRLASEDKLAKTILYCLNPKDNEVMMTMAYTFNDGTVPGKMQFGSGWWFLDQEDGMRKQMNALSNLGLLSRFVGMLTDSRSFISYPRHEYFRRILCDVIGADVENGKLPASEIDFLGQMIEDICYNNAKNYFNF